MRTGNQRLRFLDRWILDQDTRYARVARCRCSLKSRRSAVTELNASWHGINKPEALRNEPEALRKTRNDKTGGRGQLSSPRALPGVPAPPWSLARTGFGVYLSQELVPTSVRLDPVRGSGWSRTAFSRRLKTIGICGFRPLRFRPPSDVDDRGVRRGGRDVEDRFRCLL